MFHMGHPLHAVEGGVGIDDAFGVSLPLLVSVLGQVIARPGRAPTPLAWALWRVRMQNPSYQAM
jgi:hypothetical protein